MKGYQHENVALEVLKKLLSDELRARARTNLVQSRSLMEMLETSIKKYPPDMQLLATETVLRQAEMLANQLSDAS